MRWTRSRTYAVVGLIAVSGLALAVSPAFGTDGPRAVHLHLGTDFQGVEFEGQILQTFTESRCELQQLDGPLLSFEANRKVGINAFGIGVKSGGAQGTPCGRVDVTESLTVAVPIDSESPIVGRMFSGMQLDLELKGNARVRATLHNDAAGSSVSFELGSGSSIQPGDVPAEQDDDDGAYRATSTDTAPNVACGAQSDSGPDSGASDNCLWTIEPAFEFNRVVFKALVGEFSLEGSGDYANDRSFDSLFFLANAAPTASDITAATDEDTPVNIDVLAGATDPDGDDLTVTVGGTTAEGALVSVNADGTVKYDPNAQFEPLNAGDSESDSFTFTVSDGKGGSVTATATVTVNGVNDGPTFGPSTASGDEDTPIGVTLDIDDIDDTSFTTVCTPQLDVDGQPIGSFVVNTTGTGGTYTPPDDFNGTVILNCTVTDSGSASASGTVTITVIAVNDDPVANNDVFYVDDADGSTVVDPTTNDTDIDGDTLTVSAVNTTDTLGSVSLDAGVVTYTPPADFLGTDSFGYTVSDGNGGEATATVTIEEVIQCGEVLSVQEGEVWAKYLRIDDATAEEDCVPKPYDLEIIDDEETEPFVKFVPREPIEDGTPVDAPASFSAELSFEPLVATTNAGGGDASNLEYDADAEGNEFAYVPMQWCEDSTLEFDVVAGDLIEVRAIDAKLPTGETWCIAYKRTFVEVVGEVEKVRTVWTVFGIGDPFKRLS